MDVNNHSIAAEQARVIAERFLARQGVVMPSVQSLKPRGHHYEYVSGDGDSIYEFPLAEGNDASGYVLISGTKSLPPILEFCAAGNTLQEKLNECLSGLLRFRAIEHRNVTWRYFGPMDFVAELATGAGRYVYVRVPNVYIVSSDLRIMRKRRTAPENVDWIGSRWDFYEATTEETSPLSAGSVLGCRPIKYNQTCQSSLKGVEESALSEGPNYCTPVCITGCVATAWTVLAGTWKGYRADPDIFSDAPDWYFDWQSSYGGAPPPHSKVVNQRMWDVHGYLGTSCGGSTSDPNTPAGSRLFSFYGKPWAWGARFSIDYAFAASVNKANQPGLLTAQSVWVPGGGVDGHGVVTYGWNDGDHTLFICLGWGSAFPDKWISFAALASADAFFVTAWNANEETTLPERNVPAAFREISP